MEFKMEEPPKAQSMDQNRQNNEVLTPHRYCLNVTSSRVFDLMTLYVYAFVIYLMVSTNYAP